MASNKEVRELEIKVTTPGVEQAKNRIKSIQGSVLENDKMFKSIVSSQSKMLKALGLDAEISAKKQEKALKAVEKIQRRFRGIAREQDYISGNIPKNIGYKNTNKYAGVGYSGSVKGYKRKFSRVARLGSSGLSSAETAPYGYGVGGTAAISKAEMIGRLKSMKSSSYTKMMAGAPKPSLVSERVKANILASKIARKASRQATYGKGVGGMLDGFKDVGVHDPFGEAYAMNKEYDKKAWDEAHEQNGVFNQKKKEEASALKKAISAKNEKIKELKLQERLDIKEAKQLAKDNEKAIKEKEKQYSKGLKQTNAMRSRGAAAMRRYKKNLGVVANKHWENVLSAPGKIRDNVGSMSTAISQGVGELTMFAGALMMVGMAANSAFANLMAVGDMFAGVEKASLARRGAESGIFRDGGQRALTAFRTGDRVNQQLGGYDRMTSGEMMGRHSSTLKEMGGSVTDTSMSGLAIAAHGAGYLTGKKAEDMFSKVLSVAKKGKGQEQIGLAGLKLTKSMDENIALIAKAMINNPISGKLLEEGSIEGAMNKIRNAPKALAGNVYEQHKAQASRIFNRAGNSVMNAANNENVIYAWERALTNLDYMVNQVFTDERLEKAGVGAARWAAELTNIGGNMILAGMWLLENSDKVINYFEKFALVMASLTALKFSVGLFNLAKDLHKIGGSLWYLGKAGAENLSKIEALSAAGVIFSRTIGKVATGLLALIDGVVMFLAKLHYLKGSALGFFLWSKKAGEGSDDLNRIRNILSPEDAKVLQSLKKDSNAPSKFDNIGHLYESGTGRETYNSITKADDMQAYLNSMRQSSLLHAGGMIDAKLQGQYQAPYQATPDGNGYQNVFLLNGDIKLSETLDLRQVLGEGSGY